MLLQVENQVYSEMSMPVAEASMTTSEDFDPGAPADTTEAPIPESDIARANFGEDGAGGLEGGRLEAPGEDFGHPGISRPISAPCTRSSPRA